MKWIVVLVIVGASIVTGFSAAYTVPQGWQAIVTQFGKPVGEPIAAAGLHFKTPFVQDVRYFEARVLDWDGEPNQIPTRDKRFIAVDTTARWRIADPLLFLQEVKDEIRAQTLLDDILDAATRDAVSGHNLIEAVRSSNRKMRISEEFTEDELEERAAHVKEQEKAEADGEEMGGQDGAEGQRQKANEKEKEAGKTEPAPGADKGGKAAVPSEEEKAEEGKGESSGSEVNWNDDTRVGSERIHVGRRELAKIIFNSARTQVQQYGIDLVDFRIKAINYVQSVRTKVYERMISERNKIAERYRSEGQGKAAFIDGQRRRQLLEIESGAYKDAQLIRGDAEAEATRIYAESYSQDPEFFNFMETLAAYPKALDKDTMLILSTDSPFYKYLKQTKD